MHDPMSKVGGAVLLACLVPALAAGAAELPPDSDYVTVRDGHLSLDGRRVRFWGAVGSFPGRNHADNEAVVRRLKAMGFNLVRYWRGFAEPVEYAKGDGSRADLVDHFLWCLKKEGMHAWNAGIGGRVGKAMPDDVGILEEPATAEAWREAVGPDGMSLVGRENMARTWDARLEGLCLARMKSTADHVNQWTGLRWADDPVFAVWELSNEEWWFSRMAGDYAFWAYRESLFPGVPGHFQRQFIEKWNAFLKDKYRTDEALRTAWLGLLEGESVEKGTALLMPLRTPLSADDQRKLLGLEPRDPPEHRWTQDDFNTQRGGDVVEFLLSVQLAHKQREAQALKSWGKSCRIAPLVWDTGWGREMPAQFLHQHADAVTHVTYLRGFTHDPTHKRFPWYSGLEELPRLCWDLPGLEQNRFPGKPFLVYENQLEQPAKYRGEYPLRMAAMGAIQDWDAIVWHYFGPAPDSSKEKPYEKAMDYTSSQHGHPQGLHFQYDEVQMSAMRAASEVFRGGLLEPAAEPTRVTFGRKSLYDLRKALWGEWARYLIATPYLHGLRIVIDPRQEEDEIVGPTVRDRDHLSNPVVPTGQIAYDWQRGHLKFDAPAVAMYTGFFAQHGGPVRFDGSGVVLRDVRVENPPDMPYPVGEDERYVTFCLVSTDGRPLGGARRAILSATSTSFNSGFELDHSKFHRPLLWQWNKGVTVSKGGLPVLVARVGATVEAPILNGMRYRMLDWHLEEVGSGVVRGGTVEVPAERPVFLVELERGSAE